MRLNKMLKQEKELCLQYKAMIHDSPNSIEIKKIKQEIRTLSKQILEELEVKIPFDEQGYEQGSSYLLKKYGNIFEILQTYLSKHIPDHPKDEYPLARQLHRNFIIHSGPTNSGKTFMALEALKKGQNGIYLAPLRLLALEIFEKLNEEKAPCNLLTGEEEISVPRARYTSCTIEKANYDEIFDVAVVDEGQLFSDSQRGSAWTRSILGLQAYEIHICCSPNAVPLVQRLIEDCQDSYQLITHHRQTPLHMEERSFSFPEDVLPGDALIVFSRKMVLQVASALDDAGIKPSLIYGNLPPETRKKQVERFCSGESEVVVATDAIGMGLNLPIRRIVFLEVEKYDGKERRLLTSQEVKQIAGRAGRRGIYEKGWVNALHHKEFIEKQLLSNDEKIRTAFILPTDELILSIPIGNLLQRLTAWAEHRLLVSYFDKSDISDQLFLYHELEDYHLDLDDMFLYRVIRIPFNIHETELVKLWKEYIFCIMDGKQIFCPHVGSSYLNSLEIEYKSIDLYYSFCKNFKQLENKIWIDENRKRIANKIHEVLVEHIRRFQQCCDSCGEPLPWNFIYTTCKNCR